MITVRKTHEDLAFLGATCPVINCFPIGEAKELRERCRAEDTKGLLALEAIKMKKS
jgi:hypothetical protein